MQLLIHYHPAQSRADTFIHAWEPAGKVWDFLGEKNPDGSFLFRVKGVGSAVDMLLDLTRSLAIKVSQNISHTFEALPLKSTHL